MMKTSRLCESHATLQIYAKLWCNESIEQFSMWACKSRPWAYSFLLAQQIAFDVRFNALFIIIPLISIGVVDDLVVNVVRNESVLMNDDEHDGTATRNRHKYCQISRKLWWLKMRIFTFFTYKLVSWSVDCRLRMLHKCNWRRCRFGKSFPLAPEKAKNLDFTVANRLRVHVSM